MITLIVFGINIFMLLIFYQKEDCFHSGDSNSYFYVDNAYDKAMIEKMEALHLMPSKNASNHGHDAVMKVFIQVLIMKTFIQQEKHVLTKC